LSFTVGFKLCFTKMQGLRGEVGGKGFSDKRSTPYAGKRGTEWVKTGVTMYLGK